MSLPAPPSSTSSPRMPRSRSSPPRPTRRSAPRVPLSVSGPSVPVSSASPGCTTSGPASRGRTVRSRVPLNADRTEIVRRALSETYRRVRRATRSRGRGRRRSAGGAITRRLVRSTSAALRWMPRSFAPGATIARVPSGETPTPPPPSVPSVTAPTTVPRPGSIRTSRDAGRLGPCAASSPTPRRARGVDAHAGGAGELQPAHEPAGRRGRAPPPCRPSWTTTRASA